MTIAVVVVVLIIVVVVVGAGIFFYRRRLNSANDIEDEEISMQENTHKAPDAYGTLYHYIKFGGTVYRVVENC